MLRVIKCIFKALCLAVISVTIILILFTGLLNTSLNKRLAAAVVPEFIDGEVQYSRLRLHLLPEISLSVDSLVVRGRLDTIATAGRIRARLGIAPLLHGRIRFSDITVNSLYANLWKDRDGNANWNIVKSPAGEDTVEQSRSPLDIAVNRLSVDGRIAYSVPEYAVLVDVDSILLRYEGNCIYNAAIGLGIEYVSDGLGRIAVPFGTRGKVGYRADSSSFTVVLDSMKTDLAYIPMILDGTVESTGEGYDLNMDLGVEDCQLKPILDNYLAEFAPDIANKVTSGTISFRTHFKGLYSDDSLPDIDGSLRAGILGADIRFDGRVVDAASGRPGLEARASIRADLDSFMRFVPDSMDIDITGNVDISLEKPCLADQSFTLYADLDSLSFRAGKEISAKLRGMHNAVTVTYVNNRFGKRVPKLEVSTDNRQVRLLYDGNRVMLKDFGLTASLQKIKMDTAGFIKRFAMMPRPKQKPDSLPEFLSEKDFEISDISFSTDSTVAVFLSKWSPAGKIHLGRGMVVSPQFPLRVRINGIDGNFDSNRMDIEYAGVQAGRSDFAVAGDLSGYGMMLRGRKGVLRLNLDAYSKRCNVNELMVAVNKGDSTAFVENGDVQDESFAIDTLTDEQIESATMPLLVIPANLIADINLNADSVRVADLDVTPFEASIRVRERTLQLLSSKLATNIGEIDLDAYYSTKSKKNISAGINMEASDISAEGIIHVIPSVDSLFPILKSFNGNMSARVTATTQLDTNMNVIQPSLNAMFRIYGRDLMVDDAGNLKKVTRLLLFRNPDIGRIQDMSVGGVISDSRIEIYPFILGVDRYKLALSGVQGFDGDMNYHASILRSPLLIRFGIDIKGDKDNWKWRLCKARYKSSYAPVFTQRIDTMQFNLAQSIKSVYERGVEYIEKAARMQVSGISAEKQADDSLQMTLLEEKSSSADIMSDEELQTSFDEKSQARISSLREKTEQRAVTRRSEIIGRKEQKK